MHQQPGLAPGASPSLPGGRAAGWPCSEARFSRACPGLPAGSLSLEESEEKRKSLLHAHLRSHLSWEHKAFCSFRKQLTRLTSVNQFGRVTRNLTHLPWKAWERGAKWQALLPHHVLQGLLFAAKRLEGVGREQV